jgi:hypothetical protein
MHCASGKIEHRTQAQLSIADYGTSLSFSFFSEMGHPQPLHQNDAYGFLYYLFKHEPGLEVYNSRITKSVQADYPMK